MAPTPTFKRFFTPEEANLLLPEVLNQVETARRLLDEARQARNALHEATTDEERSDAYCRVEERRSAINQILMKLRQRGIEIKGLDPILLDLSLIHI